MLRLMLLIILTGQLFACTSKSDYEKVSACYSKNVSSFQTCCQEYQVDEARCNEYGTKRSQELADKMTGK